MTFRRGRGRRGFGTRGYIVTPPGTTPPVTPGGDVTAPTYVSGSVDQSIATLVFSEPVIVTSVDGMVFSANGAPIAVASIVGGSGTNTIALALASPVAFGETVLFAYTSTVGASNLRDSAGNEMVTVSNRPVTNNTQASSTVPVVSNVVINDTTPSEGIPIGVTFDVTGNPPASISYLWERTDGTDVGTSSQYTPNSADVTAGLGLRVTVTATNVAGTHSVTSAATSAPTSSGVLREFYVSPTGNNANAGTIGSPWATLQRFMDQAIPGDKCWLRGNAGEYTWTTPQRATGKNGTAVNRIYVESYPGETAVINGSSLTGGGSTGIAMRLTNSSYWHIKKVEIKNAPDFGFYLDGSSGNNVLEWMMVHDINGGPLAESKGFAIFGSGANNYLLNCDGYNCRDINQDNADGFQIATTGAGTILENCRAWNNSDDGFDLFNINNNTVQGRVTLKGCWAMKNGYLPNNTASSGDGSGFKLGGKRASVASTTTGGGHTIYNSLAFDNRLYGFLDNEADRPLTVYNCTAHNNGSVNFEMSWADSVYGVTHTVRNCLAVPGTGTLADAPGANVSHNSWQLAVTVSAADFLSVSSANMKNARGANGELPVDNYLKLVTGSDLIDKGTNVGLPFNGTVPDLGAYEHGTTEPIPIPWTPAQIDTEFWHDYSDAATFVLSGSSVTSVTDKSGKGGTGTGVVGNQPNRVSASTIHASLGAIRVTGGTQRMTIPSSAFVDVAFSALYPISATAVRAGIGDGVVDSSASTFDLTTASIVEVVATAGAPGSFQFYDTGVAKTSASSPPTNMDTGMIFVVMRASTMGGNGNGRILDGTSLFNRSAGDRGADADFGEILWCEANDTTTRQLIEGYLAWKWDGGSAGTLVGKLPAGHPYKSARPVLS